MPSGSAPGMPPGPPRPGGRPVVPIVVGVVLLVALAVGAVLVLSGDDDSGETDASASTTPSGDEPEGGGGAAGRAVTSLTGTWEGTYECGGSTSGLTLTVDDSGDGTLGANFAFHPTDESPDAPTGRFSMEGTVADGHLSLAGAHWIDPEESETDDPMPGLEADLGDRADSEQIEGTVVGDGCAGFTVERTSTDPWYAGVWEGVYGCAQGLTGLRLTVEPERDDVVQAVYEFYAPPENPEVPSGSYRMEGTYDEERELSLHGTEWIERPGGYVMVGLNFLPDLGVDPLRLYGAIEGLPEGCSVFTLSRPAD
jgi:hypothetical protein